MRSATILFLSCLLAMNQANSQETVTLSGRVVDSITGEPIAGAVIRLSGLKIRPVSDSAGNYIATALSPGKYLASISCHGYESSSEELTVAENQRKDFRLYSSFVTDKDRKKDVILETNYGNITLRLSDSTSLHRDNFLALVKRGFYDGILFHRVIKGFMIQAGDPESRDAKPGQPLGAGGPHYRIPAEFRTTLFHRKGVLAAARDNNPLKASSASQFYIVVGRVFTDQGLDSVETFRLNGRKIPSWQREVYKTIGGTPHLDQGYTVFGEVVKGQEVVDAISNVATSQGVDRDRPLEDVRIVKAHLVKREKFQ